MRIEDKEDVIALQQARREIDDEFDEEAAAQEQASKDMTVASGAAEGEKQAEEEQAVNTSNNNKAMAAELDARSAGSLQRDMMAHKSEFINWREHPTLNTVTKLAINYFEHHYDFDNYLDDRSKKDTKFVNPLADDVPSANAGSKDQEEEEASDFSMASGGEDEEEETGWDRGNAEMLYKQTKENIYMLD